MGAGESILVVGGGGLLGQALVRRLQLSGVPFEAPGRSVLDLGDAGAVRGWLRRSRWRAVINVAAYSDVTRAEQPDQRDTVFRINRDVPAELARSCARRGLRYLFVSTDFVFDGRKARPYRETDEVSPLQVYGVSKLEGENAVLEAYPETLVIRTSTLFGPGRRPRPHYVDAILRQAAQPGSIAVVRTPVASPTYTPDLASMLVDLVDRDAVGVIHGVNSGQCSRLDLARETVRLAGAAERVKVLERPDPGQGPRRPPYSALDATRLTELTGRPPRSWNAALADYLKDESGRDAGL